MFFTIGILIWNLKVYLVNHMQILVQKMVLILCSTHNRILQRSSWKTLVCISGAQCLGPTGQMNVVGLVCGLDWAHVALAGLPCTRIGLHAASAQPHVSGSGSRALCCHCLVMHTRIGPHMLNIEHSPMPCRLWVCTAGAQEADPAALKFHGSPLPWELGLPLFSLFLTKLFLSPSRVFGIQLSCFSLSKSSKQAALSSVTVFKCINCCLSQPFFGSTLSPSFHSLLHPQLFCSFLNERVFVQIKADEAKGTSGNWQNCSPWIYQHLSYLVENVHKSASQVVKLIN